MAISSAPNKPPVVLTIAGFDPSSGAGATADLQVFASLGLFGTACLTALTVQSTTGVRRVQPVNADLLREMLSCLIDDLPPSGIKIGMLGNVQVTQVVGTFLRELSSHTAVPVVIDPVLRSSSGDIATRRECRSQFFTKKYFLMRRASRPTKLSLPPSAAAMSCKRVSFAMLLWICCNVPTRKV